jgi:hypothetical protein|tara:strand:- start:1517 stop:2092 length:576 start_codon:yes stop_codon:yes gene_type:complete
MTDIDIDFKDRTDILNKLHHIPASIIKDNNVARHNTGIYFHEIPVDPFTGNATLDYKKAEELGYFKIDCLNVNMYKDVESEEHLLRLIDTEPDWELFQHSEIVEQLFHIHDHFNIVSQMKPQSVEQLAMVLAIIRPAKRSLLGESWQSIQKQVWLKPIDNSYYFKKSHAMSYALAIVVQLNLLVDSINFSN